MTENLSALGCKVAIASVSKYSIGQKSIGISEEYLGC